MRISQHRVQLNLLAVQLLATMACATVAQSPSTETVVDAARRAADFRLQPGDRVAVNVLDEKELNDTVMVNERGEAAFAKLGVLQVGVLSAASLQDTLRARYAKYLRNPALEIVVLRKIGVNGEVKNPDVYLVDVSTTLRDVIAKAGGVTEFGKRSHVYVVRADGNTRVDGWDRSVGSAGDLRSGDQVIVPRKSWWAINAFTVVYTVVIVTSLVVTIAK